MFISQLSADELLALCTVIERELRIDRNKFNVLLELRFKSFLAGIGVQICTQLHTRYFLNIESCIYSTTTSE